MRGPRGLKVQREQTVRRDQQVQTGFRGLKALSDHKAQRVLTQQSRGLKAHRVLKVLRVPTHKSPDLKAHKAQWVHKAHKAPQVVLRGQGRLVRACSFRSPSREPTLEVAQIFTPTKLVLVCIRCTTRKTNTPQ